tara:strand:- start:3117 stop:3782 length:666 start_codon:yes stop_codon:yes gene_type:complete
MNFFFSTIGRKIQIAFTGLVLSFFLLFHLINNLALYFGPTNFNAMVAMLESIKPIIRIMEFSLLIIILMHIFNAIILTVNNMRLRKNRYQKNISSTTSSFNSRTMIFTGSTVMLFLFVHLGYIWRTFQTHSFYHGEETYYHVILRNDFGYLNHTPTAIFYIIAILMISFHLKHGFESALKTLGMTNSGSNKILYKLSILFWGIIPFGFITIILSIQLGIIK